MVNCIPVTKNNTSPSPSNTTYSFGASETVALEFIDEMSRKHALKNVLKNRIALNIKCDFCNIEVTSLAQKTEHMLEKHPQQLQEQVSYVNHDLLLTKTTLTTEVIIWIEYKPI